MTVIAILLSVVAFFISVTALYIVYKRRLKKLNKVDPTSNSNRPQRRVRTFTNMFNRYFEMKPNSTPLGVDNHPRRFSNFNLVDRRGTIARSTDFWNDLESSGNSTTDLAPSSPSPVSLAKSNLGPFHS